MAVVLNSFQFVPPVTGATFIGEASTVGTTVTLHANTVAGDLVVVFLGESAGLDQPTGGSGSWNVTGVSTSRVFWKLASAGDLGVSLDFDAALGSVSSGIVAFTFRDATTITLKNNFPDGSVTSSTITGFTKSGSCKGVLASCTISNQNFSGTPTGFTGSDAETGSNIVLKAAYDTVINYSSSASVTWNFTGVVTNSYLLLLEIT